MEENDINLRNYAYIGDAIWELYVREITILRTQNAKDLHKMTTDRVKAEFQCGLLNDIEPELNEMELDLLRRARNLPVPVARRSNQAEYRMATAFETLVGWWHLNDKDRLKYIFKHLQKKI